ncbi:HK97 family phage prohead protease [Candidatus Daviesbacteria bacterium]|nr:HK97 family phage prohead protease [Candidatus Daviesbacteria bacterium]
MINEFTFLRVYKDIAYQKASETDVNMLYNDLSSDIGDKPEFNKWFENKYPIKLDKIISIDAIAHEIHANGDSVLQKIYPGADIDIFKSELDRLAGMENTNDVRKLNRGFFTTLLSDGDLIFLEKQQVGRTIKDDIFPAIEEYKKLYDAGIGSKGELLTLDRYYRGQNKKYHDDVISKGLDKDENEPMVIGGPASLEMVDKEGHLITAKALDAAFYKFMNQFRTRDINLAHTDVQIGWPLPAYITKNGSVFQSGVDDKGLWVISELRDDNKIANRVAEQIKAGVFKSYSIAGSASKTQNVQKGAQNYTQVDELSLQEITICLPFGSKIWTLVGLKNIEDIKVGEFVLTHKSRFKPVVKTFKRFTDEEIVVLKTDFGNVLKATKEHPVLVREEFDGQVNKNWVPIKNLIPSNEVYVYDSLHKNSVFTEVWIKEISVENYKGYVYNLAVEEDNSYTTEACVVHNCEKGMNQGAHFDILKGEKMALDEIFKGDWDKYADYGSGYYYKFIKENPEFDTKEFQEYVIVHNKADRDSGELGDIANFEIDRLANEFGSKNLQKGIDITKEYKDMNAFDALRKFLEKDADDRQKAHRELLDKYGFPEDGEYKNVREDKDDEIYHYEPWTANTSGRIKE